MILTGNYRKIKRIYLVEQSADFIFLFSIGVMKYIWIEHLPSKQRVAGSNPVRAVHFGEAEDSFMTSSTGTVYL